MMSEDFDIREERFAGSGEREFENALRPLRFGDFSGQQKIVENLEVFVEAAKYRGEPLDHTLLHGPPGLGKTTLSNIIANELGVGFKITSGPVLDKPGDLAGILTSLEPRDVLFIDEIHRLSPVVEEYLYSAMEDYRIDIMIDKGPSARSIQIDLNPFTLVGATTRSGLLTAPLRARFGINMHLEYYDPETLSKIIERSSNILGVPITEDAALEIAGRSRGTPRIANALLRRQSSTSSRVVLWVLPPSPQLSARMPARWRRSTSLSLSWRASSSARHEDVWSRNWPIGTSGAIPTRGISWNPTSLKCKTIDAIISIRTT